ncbi:MAG: hypothetical protein P1U53_05435, partial [Sulfitobacter sp.]|nr:hypothetical protein [Sulfitobacter sp.]
RIGDRLDLPTCDFNKAQLVTRAGKQVAVGVLGQIEGRRALQVSQGSPRRQHPARRASDRDALDLPDVGAPGIAALAGPVQDRREAWEDVTADMASSAPLAALPPMEDLPDLEDLPPYPAQSVGAA